MEARTMNHRPPIWTLALTTALALAGWSAGCGAGEEPAHEDGHHEETGHREAGGAHSGEHDDEHGEAGVVQLGPEAIVRIGLATAPATVRTLDGRRATTGEVGFDETRLAHVGSRVAGRLVRVPAELGQRVAAGEVLAVVDSVELGEAKASYLRARAHHQVARQRFERERSLHADRIVPEADVLEAEGEARESAADLAAAREALRLLGLADEEIEGLSWDDPTDARVAMRAPFTGKVVAREATLGELVSPEDVLFTIADLSEVWLWVDLYERDLAHVETGQRVEVRLDAWPGETFEGELAYIADQLEPASRTVRARVDLPNPEGRFKPGMFGRVALSAAGGEAGPPVLAVPRTAVQRDGTESIVFVHTAPGRFERREVVLGRVTDELAEVVSGLAEGDDVVTEGAFLLRSQASADQLGGHHH
jgi:cobalt-zinc-cadmium efflux system membrane fusion protein